MSYKLGGDSLFDIVNNTKATAKEKLSGLKIRIMEFLTPVVYLTYCIKFIFVLDYQRIKLLRNSIYLICLCMFCLKLVIPSLISLASIILCFVVNAVFFFIILHWKLRLESKKNQNNKYKKYGKKIMMKPKNIILEDLPDSLKKYKL